MSLIDFKVGQNWRVVVADPQLQPAILKPKNQFKTAKNSANICNMSKNQDLDLEWFQIDWFLFKSIPKFDQDQRTVARCGHLQPAIQRPKMTSMAFQIAMDIFHGLWNSATILEPF